MKKLIKQTGVTLVALVITVIVLIILAGISMNTLMGDNGIITKTKQAKENTLLAQEEETKQLNQLYEQLNNMENGNIDTGDSEAVEKLLNFKKVIATAVTNEGVVTQETDTAEVMASNIGKILQERTKGATATTGDIIEGKTAWGNGEEIIGTAKSNEAKYIGTYGCSFNSSSKITNLERGTYAYVSWASTRSNNTTKQNVQFKKSINSTEGKITIQARWNPNDSGAGPDWYGVETERGIIEIYNEINTITLSLTKAYEGGGCNHCEFILYKLY